MENRDIRIGAGYGGEITLFTLRVISQAEENRYTDRFSQISKSESQEKRSELDYGIYVDALADWSTAVPMKRIDPNGDWTPIFPETLIPAEAVREYFKTMTPESVRMAAYIILNYRSKLVPEVLFY